MSFPTPYTIGHHAYSPGGDDPYSDPPTFTPPRDQAGTEVAVIGWGAPQSQEPKIAGQNRVVVDIELYVPPDFRPGPHDLIDLPGGQFEVIGYPEDCNHGFHQWQPGNVVNLQRTEG